MTLTKIIFENLHFDLMKEIDGFTFYFADMDPDKFLFPKTKFRTDDCDIDNPEDKRKKTSDLTGLCLA